MRAGIGLIGLLITVALIMWLFATFSIPTAKVGKQAQQQARQISGRGEDGVAAMDSFASQPQFKGPTIESLSVTSVVAGGAMDNYYALRPGDAITAIQGTRIGDVSNGDDEMAKALVAEAFSKKQVLTVRRNGQMVDLPLPAGAAVPALPGAAAPAAPPAAPAASDQNAVAPVQRPSRPGGLQRQLDAIQNAAGKNGGDGN